ncbi:MAG: hypothetical protein ABIH25_03395 [Candidatus Woesearchaeota archaeon]
MAKFKEAQDRLFKNTFVCRKCKTKQKSTMQKILRGELLCRKCGGKAFRAIKKSK